MPTLSLEPCQICPTHIPCSTFDVDVDSGRMNMCFCGHLRQDHHPALPPPRVYPARGGLPDRHCMQYICANGQPITDVRQLCRCGGSYITHLPINLSLAAPPSTQPPTLHAVHSSPSFPMVRLPSQPVLLNQASGSHQQLPFSQIPLTLPRPSIHPVPQMPVITPYTPRFPTNQPPRSVFGEPVAVPGIPHGSTNRRIRAGSGRNGQIPNVHRQRDNILKLEMVLLPKDLSKDYLPQDPHGLQGPDSVRIGEDLDQDLAFLREQGLTAEVELRTSSAKDSILSQILEHFHSLARNGPFAFPDIPATSRELPLGAPDRDARNLFNSLPFHFVRIGNSSTTRSNNTLSVNKVLTYRSFGFKDFKDLFRRSTVHHPSNKDLAGLLIICPKAGCQLIGPIDENRRSIHACYSDFIIAGFMKGRMMPLPGSEQSVEESVDEWKRQYPHSCRTTCPGREGTVSPLVTENTEDIPTLAAFSPTPSPVITASPLPHPRRSIRLANIDTQVPPSYLFSPASSSSLSPLFNNAGLDPPPASPVSPQEANGIQESFTMPDRPAMLDDTTSYIPADDVRFTTLREFADHVAMTRTLPEPNSLFISGSTVSEAAQAFVLAIKDTGRSQTKEFSDSELVRGSGTHALSLGNLFQHPLWYFNAGLGEDAIGEGVMREVLLAAVQSFLTPEVGILEDLSNNDGYFTLKVSIGGFVSNNTLDNIFTLGALCAIFWLKCHAAPSPISPALIQAAIGGIDSLIDEAWVRATHEEVAETLTLLPMDGNIPIPNNAALRRLFESRVAGCRFNDILGSHSEHRPKLVRSLYIHTLLGNLEHVFSSSDDFAAFRQGFNLCLTSQIPSLINAIKTSSKYLLATSYSCSIKSPFQLLDRLQFVVQGTNQEFSQTMNPQQLDKIKKAFSRYLLGKGHPYPDRVTGLVSNDSFGEDQHDPLFRTRRFVKVTSGLATLPSDDRRFKIALKDEIPPYLRSYWDEGRIAPPASHACFFQLDVFVNEAFLKAVDEADVPLGVDTDFDWGIHAGLMKIGTDEFNGS